jgi:hypothetical protein
VAPAFREEFDAHDRLARDLVWSQQTGRRRPATPALLQWRHNGTPPDLHLQLVCDPQRWFDFVASMLLGALSKHIPELRDRLRTARLTENGKSSRPPRLVVASYNSNNGTRVIETRRANPSWCAATGIGGGRA